MTPTEAQSRLKKRLGEAVVLAFGAGRWSVILMASPNWGSGVTVTGQRRTPSGAAIEALKCLRRVGSDLVLVD